MQFLIKEMDYCIQEYWDSRDMDEVAMILGELHLSKNLEVRFLEQLLLKCMERA